VERLQADQAHDQRLARHLTSLFWEEQPENMRAMIPVDTLREYVAFARNKVNPKLGDEACMLLAQGYLEMRMAGQDATGNLNRWVLLSWIDA
jgi:DNA replication licensing factor MCM4